MNFFRIALLSLGMSFGLMSTAQAAVGSSSFRDYDFEQERMKLTAGNVFIISSFDTVDHLSSYTYYGTLEWDRTFSSKIVSWQIAGDYIFVFSKSRLGDKTYLSCLDKENGDLMWIRP